jgi:hypothetical protein
MLCSNDKPETEKKEKKRGRPKKIKIVSKPIQEPIKKIKPIIITFD